MLPGYLVYSCPLVVPSKAMSTDPLLPSSRSLYRVSNTGPTRWGVAVHSAGTISGVFNTDVKVGFSELRSCGDRTRIDPDTREAPLLEICTKTQYVLVGMNVQSSTRVSDRDATLPAWNAARLPVIYAPVPNALGAFTLAMATAVPAAVLAVFAAASHTLASASAFAAAVEVASLAPV